MYAVVAFMCDKREENRSNPEGISKMCSGMYSRGQSSSYWLPSSCQVYATSKRHVKKTSAHQTRLVCFCVCVTQVDKQRKGVVLTREGIKSIYMDTGDAASPIFIHDVNCDTMRAFQRKRRRK